MESPFACQVFFSRQFENVQVNHKLGDKPLEFALPPFPLPCACPTHKLPIPKPDRFQHQSNKTYTKKHMKVSCVLWQITKMLDNSNHLHQVNTDEVCLSAPLLVFGPCRCLSQRRLQEGLATHPVHPSLQSGPLLLLLLKKWKRSDERCGKKTFQIGSSNYHPTIFQHLHLTSTNASHLRQGSRNPGTAACLPACDQATFQVFLALQLQPPS